MQGILANGVCVSSPGGCLSPQGCVLASEDARVSWVPWMVSLPRPHYMSLQKGTREEAVFAEHLLGADAVWPFYMSSFRETPHSDGKQSNAEKATNILEGSHPCPPAFPTCFSLRASFWQ